ncbi:MAG: hypothetical protein LBP50_07450, partial [Tannerella sp.]|nr:hypothetical protein [Tannerella sp.]
RYGWSTLRKIPDLLNPYEYAKAYNDIVGDGSISDADMEACRNGTKGIDWIDLMRQTERQKKKNVRCSLGF